jgi:hypothetical protein
LQPPLVQTLEVESTLPPSPEMLACAGEVARLVARPLRGQVQRICGEKAEVNALWERVRLAHALVGRCKVGEAVAGDGAGKATLRLVGGKVEANVELTLDEGGKLRDAVFRPAGG